MIANRYDGIDLADDACRVTVLDGLPAGTYQIGVWSSRRKQPVAESFQTVTLAKKETKTASFKLKFGPKPALKPPADGYGNY